VTRVADPHVPRGEYPALARRFVVTDAHRALVAEAARIHEAEGCVACVTIRAAGGCEAAMAEVMADARRRSLERQ